LVAVPTVVAPAVPTVAMTAVSRLAPISIIVVWPAPKSATLATFDIVRAGGRSGQSSSDTKRL
jgi:hypothetical protein